MEAQPDLSADDALASVKDAIRYTFQYTEDRYTQGVDADVDRLKGAGFEQRRVNAFVPVPRGALDYPDYP